jgi:hypothetical protein
VRWIDCLACEDKFCVNNPLKCQRKLWSYSWIFFFSLFSPLFCLREFGFSIGTSCFPERLYNHCQGLRLISSEKCTKFDAVPLSDPSPNRIRPDTRLEMKGRKEGSSTSTQLRENLYIDSQDMLVLSSTVASRYYNCCTTSRTSPGSYG